MPVEANKAVVLRFIDAFSRGDLDAGMELMSPDVVVHGFPGLPPGAEAYRGVGQMFLTAFPDATDTAEDQVAEGDIVTTRVTFRGTHLGDLMGIPPTGKRVELESIYVDRIVGSRIAERWSHFDQLGLMVQLGVIPAPGQ